MMHYKKKILAFLILQIASVTIYAQDFSKPVEYLNYIGLEYSKIAREKWDYTRAIGHGKRDKLIEKRRKDLAQAILDSKRTIGKMPPFNKSTALRDSIISSMNINYIIVNQDYAKLVDMEEVKEQSYDAMEAYMLAKDLALDKQAASNDMVLEQYDRFIADNNIKVNKDNEESKLAKKMRIAGDVFEYYNKVYLIFFKSYKQNGYLMDALDKGDINGIEQNRNSLLNYAKDGIEKLKENIHYQGDETLSTACRQVLASYVDKAETKIPVMIEYFTAKDKFDKIKVTFDKIKPAQRTQQNIDTYNNAINEMNAASTKYNAANNKMNESGHKVIDNWNNKSESFLDTHIP